MGTTLDRPKVGCLDLTDVAERITQTTLHARAGLPRERNGQPKAPSNSRAAQIRKDMASGRSSEFLRILIVAYCDLEDGVPFEIATAGLQRVLAFLRIHADAIRRERGLALPRLIRDEARAQHALDMLEWRLMESATCPDVLEAAIEKAAQHIAALAAFSHACHERLASLGDRPRAAGLWRVAQ